MTVTIRGRHTSGIDYEVTEDWPAACVLAWNDLLIELDGGTPAPVEDTHVPSAPVAANHSEIPNSSASAPPKAEPKTAAEPPATAKAPAAKPAAPAEKMAANGAVCDVCQKELTAAEEKTSRLFVSRSVCKKHLQEI